MATDATGTPTALGIPKYNPNVDAPSGLGFNAAMDVIDGLIAGRIPKSLVTATGDLIYASGASTPARLAIGSAGQILTTVSGIPAWVSRQGFRVAGTAGNVTAVDAAPATVATGPAFTFDGTTEYIFEFNVPSAGRGTNNLSLWLFEDGVSLGRMGFHSTSGASPLNMRVAKTPTAGSKVYTVRASVDAGTGSLTEYASSGLYFRMVRA